MIAEVLTCPFTILIDSREQLGYSFSGLRADARQGRVPLEVSTRRATLASGDYSLEGFDGQVAVERKSLDDLYSTLGQGRERFVRELDRLSRMRFAAVVVEADWLTVLRDPPARSQLNPKTVFRSVIAWQQRYPVIHWWPAGNRRLAEVTTFRILERFWRDQTEGR